MSEKYIHKDYLLRSSLAKELYHSHVKHLPIMDFHNHLNPNHLLDNKTFKNMAEAWVICDQYKHRAMRICGVSENGITGDASDEKKFMNWARTIPKTAGNPLLSWSALELKRVFGIEETLTDENADNIWQYCNSLLKQEGYGAVDILKKFNAETLCTSDDLLDDLRPHQETTEKREIDVFPSLRGDSIVAFDQDPSGTWLERFQSQLNRSIHNLDEYKEEICSHIERFSKAGCRLADHALDNGFLFDFPSEAQAAKILAKWFGRNRLNDRERVQLKSHLLLFLGSEYARRGWTLQLHIGAQRHTSSRLGKLSKRGGFAAIGNSYGIAQLCSFFDELEKRECLPKLIIYTLNPAYNEAFATLTGSFAEDGVAGKIQFGPSWWYNDHYDGIKEQLTAITNYGLLSQFVGMTTDSRSVFSFSRHEYFRRVLCNLIAEWVEQERLQNNIRILSQLVKDVSYFNSKNKIFNTQN